jgi:ribosomal protein L36
MYASAGQGYKVKSNDEKITAFQDRYSEPRECKICGETFRILLAHWVGNTLVRREGRIRSQLYCSDECKRKARGGYGKKKKDK